MPLLESQARENIDAQLSAAAWDVQDLAAINLSAARGVAVREMRSQCGPADYILFVDGKALGIIEAKKEGTTLSSVAEQSERYSYARKWIPQRWADPLPITYETTGVETNFRDQRDPDSRSRPVFGFREKRWAVQDEEETFQKTQLDRSVVVPDQIRTIIRTFKEKLFTDLFPSRSCDWILKTLIAHAATIKL